MKCSESRTLQRGKSSLIEWTENEKQQSGTMKALVINVKQKSLEQDVEGSMCAFVHKSLHRCGHQNL